ncbi:MAG: hypothetical protein JOY70_08060 [Acidisphaera sp.]|nr:hypothetical protein [Acidisphaera sp.]
MIDNVSILAVTCAVLYICWNAINLDRIRPWFDEKLAERRARMAARQAESGAGERRTGQWQTGQRSGQRPSGQRLAGQWRTGQRRLR